MFKINNTEFTGVGIASLQRSLKRDLKYDVVTEDGRRHSEVKAIYPVYTLTLGGIRQAEYDALYAAVNTYTKSLEVTLPDGQRDITFSAMVEIGGDSLVFVERDGTRRWDGLTLTITGVTPMERS